MQTLPVDARPSEMQPKGASARLVADLQRVILVVDDALDTLHMLCDALTQEGYAVLVARDADEALQRIELTVPDGILLDAVMPGANGFELCRRIKATSAWAHVPVLFMTGLSETEQVVEGFASGGVDYVVKPLRIQEVLARLATHVQNVRTARMARVAVDIAGMGAVVLDSVGRIAWRSPQATRWLEQAFESVTAPGCLQWLISVVNSGRASWDLAGGDQLQGRHAGSSGYAESTVLLQMAAHGVSPLQINLTPRETEVLSWLTASCLI